jgi:hypothetical protein
MCANNGVASLARLATLEGLKIRVEPSIEVVDTFLKVPWQLSIVTSAYGAEHPPVSGVTSAFG